MYTVKNFRSKKELKAAVAAYILWQSAPNIYEENAPAPQPIRYFQPGPFSGNEPMNGTFCCEGPHYPEPHRWYATCTAVNGVIVKVK